MKFEQINFNKRNRRPVTETTYQIAAEEWNALGEEIRNIETAIDTSSWLTEPSWDENEYDDTPESS